MKKGVKTCGIIILFMCLCIGCTKNADKEEINKIFYEEKVISLPEGVTVLDDIQETKDGLKVLARGEEYAGKMYSFKEKTDTWEEKGDVGEGLENSAIFEAKFINSNESYASVLYQALLAKNDEEGALLEPKYFIVAENGSTKEISLDLSIGDELTEDNLFHCMIANEERLAGVDNGGIISCYSMDGTLEYTCDKPRKMEAGVAGMIQNGDEIYVALDNGSVFCLNATSGEEKEGNKKLAEFLKYTEGSYMVESDGKDVYKIQENKLYSFNFENDDEKELMDFAWYDMEDGYQYVLTSTEENGFYIGCISRNGQTILRKYTYVEEGFEVERDALTIYSLTEDTDVQTLVDAFNVQYPDIPIKVEYGYTEEDGKTREDALKLLNTEMLAGKGPDLIMLDGLNAESYIERGLLADLNDVVDYKTIEENVFSHMLKPYKVEGEQFAVPCGFSLYGITGEVEAVNAFAEVDQFLAFAEEKGLPFVVHDYNLAEAANVIYLKDIPGCFKEDGSVDRQNLERLFVHLEKLFMLSGNSFDEDNTEYGFGDMREISSMENAVEWIYYDKLPFVLSPYLNVNGIKAANYLASEEGLAYEYLERDGQLVYQDQMILGVTAGSDQMEAAGTFINYVLTEGLAEKSQDILMLPANQEILGDLLQGEQKIFTISSFGYGDNPEMIDVKGKDLTKEQSERLTGRIKNAVKAEYTQPEIREVILQAAGEECLGRKDLEQVLAETSQQIELYQKE